MKNDVARDVVAILIGVGVLTLVWMATVFVFDARDASRAEGEAIRAQAAHRDPGPAVAEFDVITKEENVPPLPGPEAGAPSDGTARKTGCPPCERWPGESEGFGESTSYVDGHGRGGRGGRSWPPGCPRGALVPACAFVDPAGGR